MLKRFFWILAVTALAGLATAQQDPFHRPSSLAGRSLLTLSLFEEVRTELKTTPEINGKEDALIEKLGGEMQEAFAGGGGDPSSIFSAIDKINNKYDDEVLKLLSAEQVARLKQLYVQYNHAAAITNPIIGKDMALSDDEKSKLKKLQDDENQKMMDVFVGGGGGSPEDMSKTLKKIQDDFSAGVEKLLTDDEKKKLKDMAGATFEFKKDAGGG